jgi:hypothetical protein
MPRAGLLACLLAGWLLMMLDSARCPARCRWVGGLGVGTLCSCNRWRGSCGEPCIGLGVSTAETKV